MEESIGVCWVCGKSLYRKISHEWKFFNGTLVCLNHNGTKEWYSGALKLGEERLKIKMEKI
jgi:hypothetical protein